MTGYFKTFRRSTSTDLYDEVCFVCHGLGHNPRVCAFRCPPGCTNKKPHPAQNCRAPCLFCQDTNHRVSACPRRCRCNDNKTYHLMSECKVKCYLCERYGHMNYDCPYRCFCESSQKLHLACDCEWICKLCGDGGHQTDECPELCKKCVFNADRPHTAEKCAKKCFLCGSRDHINVNCEERCKKCYKGHTHKAIHCLKLCRFCENHYHDCICPCKHCNDTQHNTINCPWMYENH